jgi:hypothetical protein
MMNTLISALLRVMETMFVSRYPGVVDRRAAHLGGKLQDVA